MWLNNRPPGSIFRSESLLRNVEYQLHKKREFCSLSNTRSDRALSDSRHIVAVWTSPKSKNKSDVLGHRAASIESRICTASAGPRPSSWIRWNTRETMVKGVSRHRFGSMSGVTCNHRLRSEPGRFNVSTMSSRTIARAWLRKSRFLVLTVALASGTEIVLIKRVLQQQHPAKRSLPEANRNTRKREIWNTQLCGCVWNLSLNR
jgi:hypothetical protein